MLELVSIVRHHTVFAAARAEQLARCGEKEAPAEWLSQVSQPVQDVMSAMQQMASVGVQANEQKDSSHSAVMQSMTPDALLACGKHCWVGLNSVVLFLRQELAFAHWPCVSPSNALQWISGNQLCQVCNASCHNFCILQCRTAC